VLRNTQPRYMSNRLTPAASGLVTNTVIPRRNRSVETFMKVKTQVLLVFFGGERGGKSVFSF
jgi:hypothetical protein